MKVNAINNISLATGMKNRGMNQIRVQRYDSNITEAQSDSVSFKGIKNAVKGFGALGVLGAVVGAIVSGGTSIIPTMLYFGVCNGVVGAAVGANTEDDSDTSNNKK